MQQGAAVDVFEFASHRNAVRDATGLNMVLPGEFADEEGGGFAFDGGIGCEHQFLDVARGQLLFELIEAELAWTDPVERRQAAVQHEIETLEDGRLFDDPDIGRVFDDTDDTFVACRVRADVAEGLFGQGPAIAALADVVDRLQQRFGQRVGALAVFLQQVEGHPLRSFRADAGQTAQVLYQAAQEAVVAHAQNGI